MKTLHYLSLAAVALTMAAAPASAQPDRGYAVKYNAARDHYCVRPTNDTWASRLAMPVYSTECHSAQAWLASGVILSWSDGTPIARSGKR